jgi:DNA invertase Pin-like site-specific DNA recombinase
MERVKSAIRRCAIYTRKSSEEGLEQDFNSLHAQREACEAFIRSQAGEGWRLVKTAYDDGGVSGGTMERPALQRLLADIRENGIDVVVVYKVDRLTRSLADFAKMVEVFDAGGVSFVAVTQQFNTTTSMGRLTLNVLLSFAQFEREVTGERIRDKIAASKAKGMWMGGFSPLGYDISDRRLVVNDAEAAMVRQIVARYLEVGSVRLLKQDLDRRGIVSKVRVSKGGRRSGGRPYSRGALYEMLANPIYIGEIRHKELRHPGQHQAIVDRKIWDGVQERLAQKAVRRGKPSTGALSNPLAGKLFDENGEPLYSCGASKNGRRYRYYVSRKLVRNPAERVNDGWRLSAPELERAVAGAVQQVLGDRAAVGEALEARAGSPAQLASALKAVEASRAGLNAVRNLQPPISLAVERIDLRADGIQLTLDLAQLIPADSKAPNAAPSTITRFIPAQIKRRGVELRIILPGADEPRRNVDPALLKAIARATRWFEELASRRVGSLAEIARRERLGRRYVERLARLAFVAPTIVEAVVRGRSAVEISLQMLMDGRLVPPPRWKDQQQMFAG